MPWLSHVSVQVILAAGVSEQELDADLQERLAEAEHQQDTDASLNSILVLAAQAEIDQLRNVITASSQVIWSAFMPYFSAWDRSQ